MSQHTTGQSPPYQPLMEGQAPYNPSTPLSSPQSYSKVEPQVSVKAESLPVFPKPLSTWNRFQNKLYKLWLPELIGSFISFIFLVAIFIILKIWDKHEVALDGIGPFAQVPTSVLNQLASFMRTALLIPVASGIAQLKWSWFRQRRKLYHLEDFDGATRGPIGSFILLFRIPPWHLVIVGAIITVGSLGVESTVGRSLSWRYSGDILPPDPLYPITVPRTNRYDDVQFLSSGEALGDQVPSAAMISAINVGMFYGSTSTIPSMNMLSPNCTTGFCEFDNYQTLSVNHMCQDITGTIKQTDEYYYIPKSDGDEGLITDLPLYLSDGVINSTVSSQYPDSTIFNNSNLVGPLIGNAYILAKFWENYDPFAIECVLFWAVQTLNSSTFASNWEENILETITNNSVAAKTVFNQTNPIYIEPSECWINGTLYPDHTLITDPVDNFPECIHIVTDKAQKGLQNWLSNNAYGIFGSATASSDGKFFQQNIWITYLINLLSLSSSANATSDIDTYLFKNLAISMTKSVRQAGRETVNDTYYRIPASGIMLDGARFYVRWGVMAFPAALVVGSALFIIVVALYSRQRVWKKSNLPLLFQGLGPQERASLGEANEFYDMKVLAEDMRVRFAETSDGKVRLLAQD